MGRHPKRSPNTTNAAAPDPARRKAARKRRSRLTSKVTSRWQTTLPSGVRKALELQAGDEVVYVIKGDEVVVRKATEAVADDPALTGFLDLLEQDIARHKERIVFATQPFAEYLEELTAGVEVDPEAPIEGDFRL